LKQKIPTLIDRIGGGVDSWWLGLKEGGRVGGTE